MRRVLFPLISAIAWLSLASGLAAQAPQWKEFSNETDGFRALFPSPPEFTRSSVPIAGDIFELHSYDAQVGTAALYIGVCDYGAKGVAADPEELLASARQGAVEHMHAHLVSEKHIALDASTGTAFEAESDRLHFSVRMVLSGGALYQIMVSAPLSEPFAESTRFLDSLASIPPTRPAGAAPLSAADWKPYPYPSDGFSVALPHQPSIEKQTVSSDAGPFDLRTYVAEDGSAVLITAVCDYGPGAAGKDPDAWIESAKSAALRNLKAHLVSESKLAADTHHGIAFEAESDADHVSARFYMAGNLLYQTIVIAPIRDTTPEAARFLDSFTILGPPVR